MIEGVAVGCGWQTFVAYVNVGCYYVVGVPLGSLLGFYFKLGAKVNQLYFKLLQLSTQNSNGYFLLIVFFISKLIA